MADCVNWLLLLLFVVVLMDRPGWVERHPPLRLMKDETERGTTKRERVEID